NEATIRNVFLHTFCVNFRNIHSFPTRRSSDLIVRRSSRLRPDRVYNWFRTRFGASGVATNPSVTKQAMVLRDCVRDLRYSWRQFAATPMVACVAVITLAIGIGANAAIFSLLDTALLQTLPVHDPGSLRTVEVVTRSGVEMSNIPSEFFNELRKEPQSFSGVFGFFREQLNFDTGGDIDRVLVRWCQAATIRLS